ncbi:MAG: sulfotransferase family protein, partial [Gemmataceae bacterium]
AHLTEADADHPEEIRRRLLMAWAPHWDLTRLVLVEKSPPNVIMTRFLHAAFPEAAFVMLMRHPVAVAVATQKWSHTGVGSLIGHWLVAYETMFADIAELDRVVVVRYEDLVAEPSATMRKVFATVGLPAEDVADIGTKMRVKGGLNDDYFQRWQRRSWPWGLASRRTIERCYGARVRRLSYDLCDPAPSAAMW